MKNLQNLRAGKEQVAILEHLLELVVHVVVIHGHEQSVGHDAQRDEQLHLNGEEQFDLSVTTGSLKAVFERHSES